MKYFDEKQSFDREPLADTNLDSRFTLEETFISASLAAVCVGTLHALDIAAIVSPDLVGDPRFAAIWRACVEVAQKGEPTRLDTIWTHIHERQTNSALSPDYWPKDLTLETFSALSLSQFAYSPDAVWHFARLMRREALKRIAEPKILGVASDCMKYGNDTFPIANGLRQIADTLEDTRIEEPSMSDLMARVVETVRNGEGAPLPTPWPNLNAVLKGGIANGELAVIAARPGMGKTALATCFAVETAKLGIPVLFISREVKDLTLGQRIVARAAKIDSSVFRQGASYASNLLPAIERAANSLANIPLRIMEKSIAPMTPNEIRRLARSTRNCGLVVIDYLQLLTPDNPQTNREREVAEMSRSIKQLALDCDCPVLLLSQLNRNVEETGREPRLSDLRESGAIEQDADIVIFLHAAKEVVKSSRMPAKAIVAKGRSSGTGSARLLFDKRYADFTQDDTDYSSVAANIGKTWNTPDF